MFFALRLYNFVCQASYEAIAYSKHLFINANSSFSKKRLGFGVGVIA